uniref:Flavin-containing monooxygenase n=1 Tax=Lygus hesperus TaxID=30085 RepID=A0A0A9Z036_LYGHE
MHGKQTMKICIIGFGCAGLAATRHVSADPNHECVVFEQSDRLGGTWVYTDNVGTGPYGLPVHTSMYKGLRTNLPKEVMGYPDFPIPEQDLSYIPSHDILSFLEKYAEHFNLKQYVKFEHHVKLVEPKGNQWEVTVVDLPKNEEKVYIFDAIMVCNGHYHTPWYPVIKGMDGFTGQSVHSHDYRDAQPFTGKTVAVIGAGPSGIDLALEIAKTAKKVFLSRHRGGDDIQNVFPENAEMKFEIVEIKGSKVIFDEGSEAEVDVIFYCTGYKYNFPFLSEKCGIKVEDNCVQPLYKHLIHIEHQTMSLIGLPYYVCANALFDLQVRFVLKFLKGEIKLPSKEEMYKDTEEEMNRRNNKGLKRKQFHMMGNMQGDYYSELAEAGGLEPLPPVMAQLHNHASQTHLDNLISFRNHVYKIVDSNSFLQVK